MARRPLELQGLSSRRSLIGDLALSAGTVTFGAVRDGRLDFRLVYPDLTPRKVAFRMLQGDGKSSVKRIWPDDFETTPVDGGVEGFISLGDARAFSPLRHVEIKDQTGDLHNETPEFFLRFLYGNTTGETNRCFIRTKWRTQDKETLTFACQQVRDHYTLDVGQRHMVSVIFGYRALDFGDTDLLQQAAAWLEAEIAGGAAEGHQHHKRDGTHQRISMAMALWMVHLSLGDYPAAVRTLDSAIAFMRALEQPHGLHALNGCRMMVMRAHLHQAAGDHAAALELAAYTFDFYRRCASVAEPDEQTFSEMKQGHNAAWLALMITKSIERKTGLLEPKKVFDHVHRLKDKTGIKRLSQQFMAALEWAKTP